MSEFGLCRTIEGEKEKGEKEKKYEVWGVRFEV